MCKLSYNKVNVLQTHQTKTLYFIPKSFEKWHIIAQLQAELLCVKYWGLCAAKCKEIAYKGQIEWNHIVSENRMR